MRVVKVGAFIGMLALGVSALVARASEMEITAEYRGSVQKTAGIFSNTTQGSGPCSVRPEYCRKGDFSLQLPWPGNQGGSIGTKKVLASTDPRDGFYLAFDSSKRNIIVRNAAGEVHNLMLSIDGIGWGVHTGDFLPDLQYPHGSNCHSTTPYGSNLGFIYGLWYPNSLGPTECYRPFSVTETSTDLRDISIRYTLEMADKPWSWEPGTYTGSYQYKIGQGKDLDFGNNFTPTTADDVTINFTLAVSPDMYVKFWTGQGGVISADLQPPGGWLNWNGQMPPYLSKEITFDFGSTTPVKMHLVCDHAVGKSCGIVDQQGGNALGVDTFLSANHLIDDTGKQVIRSPLSTDDHVFTPDTPGGTGVQPARLLFKTQDGVTQNMQRGHQYQGLVTVVFDSDVTP